MKSSLKKFALTTLVAAAYLTSALPASAAQEEKVPSAAQAQKAEQASHAMRASRLIGSDVKNAQGEKLGEIKDLMVDVSEQKVEYAVLTHGGILGMGDKLFAYPVRVFQPAADKDELLLNVDKEKLKDAPGFAYDQWPKWGEESAYERDVDRYFGIPTLAPKRTGDLRRATSLIGSNVYDRENQDAGDLRDLLISMNSGRVRHVVVELDASWLADGKLVALPLRVLDLPLDKNDPVLNIDRSQIDTARAFDKNDWPAVDWPEAFVDAEARSAAAGSGTGAMTRDRDEQRVRGGRSESR